MTQIKFDHVTKTFDQRNILDDVSFEIGESSDNFYYLVGESGAGKSTILSMLYGTTKPDKGTVLCTIDGVGTFSSDDLDSKKKAILRQNIGVVFQDFKLQEHLSAVQNIGIVLEYLGYTKKEIAKRTAEALDIVGLNHDDLENQKVSTLSGGEKQRVSIASVIAKRPALIIADEPTGNLDPANSLNVLDYLVKYNERFDVPVILATHDASLIRYHVGKMILIDVNRSDVAVYSKQITQKLVVDE